MKPLKASLQKLPLTSIKPKGWLLNQLLVQADGLTKNVPGLFKDLSDKSAWLGGKGECWERGPYYLDGLMPLAYLTNDEKLLALTKKWMESIFSSQQEDGFFGPKGNLDWWPRMVVTKLMPSYFEATADPRAISFLTKYYDYMLKNIDSRPFYSWANARGIEELIGLFWLYNKTEEEFLLNLMKKIVSYSMDWEAIFDAFPYTKPSSSYMKKSTFNTKKVFFYGSDIINNLLGSLAKKPTKEKIDSRNKDEFNKFYHLTHGVNLAMALKYPAFTGAAYQNTEAFALAKKGYETLIKHHGTAIGLFSCDEHLSGPSPTQGIELCTVVESMFSMEKLLEYTGDLYYADLLELFAFNALPATLTYDMCAHQYVQQVNQISATVAKRNWYDSYNRANIYGLKPNYACCLSNMHQGFPRFAEHLAFAKEDGLLLTSPVPCEIQTTIGGEDVSLTVGGNYPFNNKFFIDCKMGNQNLYIRLPSTANYIIVNGQKHIGNLIKLPQANGIFEVEMNMDVKPSLNPDNTVSYYYGNILLALNLQEEIKMNNRNDRFSDREMFTYSKWNLSPVYGEEPPAILLTEHDTKYPFREAALKVKMNFIEITNWKEEKNSASAPPDKCQLGQSFVNYLVPYGATNLRIAQFPHI